MRHVSFARSHTVTSFDNVSLKSANSSKSLERLIDGRKTPEPVCSAESPKIIVLGISQCVNIIHLPIDNTNIL